MSDNDTKPSEATRIARRAFWLAVSGGFLGLLCRLELPGRGWGLLILPAVALMLIAAAFAFVALFRSSSTDRGAVLIPALAGLFFGLALIANLNYWARDQWITARVRASQPRAQNETTPVSPARPSPAAQAALKFTVKYELPALDQIPEAVTKIRAEAARHTGEDAAVLRAWAARLEKLQAAYANTFAASNELHETNLLDARLVTSFGNDEGVRRRVLANEYSGAWRQLGETISTFAGPFYENLSNEQVSPERARIESETLFALMQQPDVTARVASWQKLCKAEKDVGRHYNYAVNAVFNYALTASKVTNPQPSFRVEMEKKISMLQEAEQAAVEARHEALGKPNQTL